MYSNLIVGGGEVGETLHELFDYPVFDINPTRCIDFNNSKYDIIHIAIPYEEGFVDRIRVLTLTTECKAVIIHSTVPPHTGEEIQSLVNVPVISSPIRGMHENFVADLKKYVKFYGFNGMYDSLIETEFLNQFMGKGIKMSRLSNGRTCELAKILCDTSYYGWLITYRNICDFVAKDNDVNPDEMWTVNEDVENKPIMYSDPNGITGHCVMPNLELVDNQYFIKYIEEVIKSINMIQKNKSK